VYRQMRAAAAQQRFERAESLRRRAGRLRTILDRLGGVLEATHARPRLILARHPSDGGPEAFWLVGGRLVDFGRCVGGIDELAERTAAALSRQWRVGEVGAHVPPDEVDEVRIVGTWLASHPDTPQLILGPGVTPDVAALCDLLERAGSGGERTLGRLERAGSGGERTLGLPEPAGSVGERKLDDDGLDLVGADSHL